MMKNKELYKKISKHIEVGSMAADQPCSYCGKVNKNTNIKVFLNHHFPIEDEYDTEEDRQEIIEDQYGLIGTDDWFPTWCNKKCLINHIENKPEVWIKMIMDGMIPAEEDNE